MRREKRETSLFDTLIGFLFHFDLPRPGALGWIDCLIAFVLRRRGENLIAGEKREEKCSWSRVEALTLGSGDLTDWSCPAC